MPASAPAVGTPWELGGSRHAVRGVLARMPPAMQAGPGTLLGVVPINGASAQLAIVGYLLPSAARRTSERAGGRLEPASSVRSWPDGLVVDAVQRRVLVQGQDVGLAFREFELLAFLTANPGRVFSRRDLLARLWEDAYRGTTRTVDVHVHRLRRKLGPEQARRLVTLRRVGYMYQPAAVQ
jgi:Transcriptional regulatory protein, C terminal